MLKIYGVPFSAHTRKVIITAIEKDIAYEIVPVIPLTPPAGWSELSPLGFIPAIDDHGFTLADSSAICQYLERSRPQHALYPSEARALGQALWLEEFIDGGLQQHVLRGLLMQRVFAPKFLQQAPDEALIQKSLTEMIPPRLAYLEHALSGEYFVGEAFSIADITITSILINYHYAGETLDEAAHPKLYRYLRRMLKRSSFEQAFKREIPAAESIGALNMGLLRECGY